GAATAVLVQPDGKIVSSGYSSNSGFNQSFSVVRLTSTGALDQTFDGDGIVKTTPNLTNFHSASDAGLTIDAKIVLVGSSSIGANHRPAVAALRYNADGSLDSSFGGTGYVVTDLPADTSGGVANGVAVQADGKVVAAGIAVVTGGYQSMLLRYNND